MNIPILADGFIKFFKKQLTVTTENKHWQKHHVCQQHASHTQEQEVRSHYGECEGTNLNRFHLGVKYYHSLLIYLNSLKYDTLSIHR